ncbi:MAG: 3-deoxy-manno-octulosonate cytidylyltransferase [Candidatus Omnitrophica bacterium]|nr:3-deoxy-manno-octulosonate cytidylyltransferase [Candidatus Omnitrophota bacterium]
MKRTGIGQKVLVVIPARYASTRFEGKPLAMIAGKPMIYHVYNRAVKSKIVDEVVVATDDERILLCVEGFGGKAVMTSSRHQTGTDRIAEVAEKRGADIIVNVQGDEPLLDPEMISQAAGPLMDDRAVNVVTLAGRITDPADLVDLMNVKVVMDVNANIMFMSRAPIPYPKARKNYCVYKQIGLYAFRRDYLLRFAAMKQTPLEIIEGIELLRVLENGHKLKGVVTKHRTYSVDTPSDLVEVNRIFAKMKNDRGTHE